MPSAARDNGVTGRRRLDSLEGLRFLSSLIIVAGHYMPYVVDTPLIARTHMAVDLFFVISGIVIAETYGRTVDGPRAWLRFIGRRVARLYPLHLLTLAFYVGLGVLVWRGLAHPVDAARYNPAAIVPNLMMTQAWLPDGVISFNYVSWSISAEFLVYLLYPLTVWGMAGRPVAGLVLVAALLLAGIAFAELVQSRPLTRLSWDGGAVRALPSFAFGVWVSSIAPKLAAVLPRVRLRAAFVAMLVLTALLFVVAIDQYATLLVIWAMVALAFLCDRAGVATPVSVAPLARHGALTYSIYMLHTVVATIVLTGLPRLLGPSLPARLGAMVVALAVLYVAATLSLRWFEQPLRRAINARTDRWLGSDPVSRAA